MRYRAAVAMAVTEDKARAMGPPFSNTKPLLDPNRQCYSPSVHGKCFRTSASRSLSAGERSQESALCVQ